ncbi:MAG: c-type cytochrome [Desulfuromonadaceae bacterium]|nr:c-type cytochrome [Desulfuromonadaceae bacterium]
MRKTLVSTAAVLAVCLFASAGYCETRKGEKISGKNKFEEHCAACHPGGGNTINQMKTLHKNELKANGVKSAKDIIAKIRNPGPGMTKFDEKNISNAEAKAIAEYVQKTFK